MLANWWLDILRHYTNNTHASGFTAPKDTPQKLDIVETSLRFVNYEQLLGSVSTYTGFRGSTS